MWPGDTAFFSLFDEEDAVWGTRPTGLVEPQGPQERSSGTLWSSLPTLLQWYRSSTYQCRRWWTSWWTSSSSFAVPKIPQDSIPHCAVFVRSGCPWLMQRKFQQSKVYQFIDRLVVPVVTETGTHSAFSKTVKTPLVQFLDRLLTPGVQRQVQMAQTVQKTVELPQVQLLRSSVAFSRREQWRCLSFSHRQSLMMKWRQMGSF